MLWNLFRTGHILNDEAGLEFAPQNSREKKKSVDHMCEGGDIHVLNFFMQSYDK